MTRTSLDELDREGYINLATFRRTGKEVRTPVWFAGSDGRLYVFSAADAGKVKRLRHTARIRLAACNVRGKVHGEWLEGVGRLIEDQKTIDTAYAALLKKYGWQMRLANFFSRLSGRIDNRAIIQLELA